MKKLLFERKVLNEYEKKQKNDLKLGNKGEQELKPIIDNLFDTQFFFTSANHNFDFIDINNKIYVELKTRRCKHNKYKTLYFSHAKKEFIDMNPDYDYYLFFKCTDGIYYWQYDEEKIFISEGGRKDRGRSEIKKVCNVPTNLLIKV